jgi:RNA polymerase sigma-70 factor (ECF subfamily)
MDERDWQAGRFEEHRGHLRAVAYRMLGSAAAAEDAVQEAWLRLSRSDTSAVENLGGWLTTVVARVCLDMLRSRKSRREDPLDDAPEPAASSKDPSSPDHEVLLADSVGLALLVVLETLAPAERVAFSSPSTCRPTPSAWASWTWRSWGADPYFLGAAPRGSSAGLT